MNIFYISEQDDSRQERYEPRQARYRLENDPSCGVTTGGRPECWWDCYTQTIITNGNEFFHPPSCLADCYQCLSSLLADYQAAGGVCQGSYLDVTYPGLFNVSDQSCELDDYYGTVVIVTGLCSERTKELLRDQENCVHPIFNEKEGIWWTTTYLIESMCDDQTHSDFYPAPLDRRMNNKRNPPTKETLQPRTPQHLADDNDEDADGLRLIPIEVVHVSYARVPPLENTKHRYPWICSLRSVGQQAYHICGVTLLSRPPGPTVLVTSAHCVYICKSEEGRLVPNCCCPNVGPGLCTETEDCGTNATTAVMTGAEAEVICGEWDTATDTEEDYNVILPIKKIVVHPDFQISRGDENSQFVASDIAVIKVEDRDFEAQSRTHNIYPACLPSPSNNNLNTTAIHSGWSKPPPLEYVTAIAPAYEEVYGEFFKQWHYSMNITKCEDPKTMPLSLYPYTGEPLSYPSNSYYPPGTVCALERDAKFCPTSGESGSPLMVTDDEGRMVAEGINSFIKVLKI